MWLLLYLSILIYSPGDINFYNNNWQHKDSHRIQSIAIIAKRLQSSIITMIIFVKIGGLGRFR